MGKSLNLNYVYAVDSQGSAGIDSTAERPLDYDDLQPLPIDTINQLLIAAKLGDIVEMLTLTSAIPEEYAELKVRLDRHINDFQLQNLIQALEEMLELYQGQEWGVIKPLQFMIVFEEQLTPHI